MTSSKILLLLLATLFNAHSSEARTFWRRPTSAASLSVVRGGGGGTGEFPTSSTTRARGGSTTTHKQQTPLTSSSLTSQASVSPLTNSIHVGGATTATSSKSLSPTQQQQQQRQQPPQPQQHQEEEEDHPHHALTRSEKAAAKQLSKEHKRHKKIAKKLKNRNHTNLRRKVMHASFGFFFAALNHFIPRTKFVPGMTILTSATLLMELLRYRKGFGWMNDILHFVLGSSLRKHEMDGKFTGSFYYFLGVTLTAWLYPKSSATLGILQLAIADPSASYFGRATRHVYWSRIENGLGGLGRNKGILGFLGGALACLPINYELLRRAQFTTCMVTVPTQKTILVASTLLGLAGAFADLAVPTPALTLPKKVAGVRVPPFHIDDNVVVPVFSGLACTKIFQYLQIPLDLKLAKFLIV